MMAKKHEVEYKLTLAVCDKEHIGKTFEDGNICFTASERFYKGEDVTKEDLLKLFEEADSINLFGNKCVGIAIEKGLVGDKSIIVIKGIKHAQVYRLQ